MRREDFRSAASWLRFRSSSCFSRRLQEVRLRETPKTRVEVPFRAIGALVNEGTPKTCALSSSWFPKTAPKRELSKRVPIMAAIFSCLRRLELATTLAVQYHLLLWMDEIMHHLRNPGKNQAGPQYVANLAALAFVTGMMGLCFWTTRPKHGHVSTHTSRQIIPSFPPSRRLTRLLSLAARLDSTPRGSPSQLSGTATTCLTCGLRETAQHENIVQLSGAARGCCSRHLCLCILSS